MAGSSIAMSDHVANRRRLWQTVRDIAILLAVASLVALLSGAVRLARAKTVAGWPQAPGVITAAGIETAAIPGRAIRYVPAVSMDYTYEVAGHDYDGDRINLETTPIEADSAEAHRLLATYAEGTAVMVRYNPADAAESALEAAPVEGLLNPGLFLLGLAAFAGVLALVVRRSSFT